MPRIGDNSKKNNVSKSKEDVVLGGKQVSIGKDEDANKLFRSISTKTSLENDGDILLESNIDVTQSVKRVSSIFQEIDPQELDEVKRALLKEFFPDFDSKSVEDKEEIKRELANEINKIIQEGKPLKEESSFLPAATMLFIIFINCVFSSIALTVYNYLLIFILAILGVMVLVRMLVKSLPVPSICIPNPPDVLLFLTNTYALIKNILVAIFANDEAKRFVAISKYATGFKIRVTSFSSLDLFFRCIQRLV